MAIRRWLALAALAALAAGCRATASAPTNGPLAPPSGPKGAAPPSAGGPAGAASNVRRPRYVPPPLVPLDGLVQDDTLDTYAGEKKTFWEKTTEKFSPTKIGKDVKKAMGRGPNETLAHKKFEEGQALFRAGDYPAAAKCLKIAADRWPDSDLEEDSLYLIAESYFFSDRYPAAHDAYGMLLKKYENSRHLVDVIPRQFAIARYWDQKWRIDSHWYPNLTDKTRPLLDAWGRAINAYNIVKLHDAQGPMAADATMAMGNLNFLRDRFEDACFYYDDLRKTYPQSQHLLTAHILGIRAKLRSYLGPQYESKPLDDAEQLIELTLTQFPSDMLGEDRERLLQARKMVRIERAQRDFQAGEYYYKKGYFQGARFYYAAVIRDYPDTPFTQLAENRMDETKDYPPVPPDHFKWVKKLLPASKTSMYH
jgi:outer membrane protein assembly factor BamD (BamD/ComL family)